MKLKRHKDIASLFINKKKVEEDCEGMTAGSVLAPSAQATGGDITNTDSYAPGDNRLPKSLFRTRVIKRKYKEEDSEEYPKIPSDFFTDEEWEQINRDVDQGVGSMNQVKLMYFKEKGGLDPDRPMTDQEIKNALDEMKSFLSKYN